MSHSVNAAVNLRKSVDGGLHRSRDHLMLVMLSDGNHRVSHARDAAGAGDLRLTWRWCWNFRRRRHRRDAGDGLAIRCDAVSDL